MDKLKKFWLVVLPPVGLVVLIQVIYILSLVPHCMRKCGTNPRVIQCTPQVVNTIVACCCKSGATCTSDEKQYVPVPPNKIKKKAAQVKARQQSESAQKIIITVKDERGEIAHDVHVGEGANINEQVPSQSGEVSPEIKMAPKEAGATNETQKKSDIDVKKLYVGDKQQ